MSATPPLELPLDASDEMILASLEGLSAEQEVGSLHAGVPVRGGHVIPPLRDVLGADPPQRCFFLKGTAPGEAAAEGGASSTPVKPANPTYYVKRDDANNTVTGMLCVRNLGPRDPTAPLLWPEDSQDQWAGLKYTRLLEVAGDDMAPNDLIDILDDGGERIVVKLESLSGEGIIEMQAVKLRGETRGASTDREITLHGLTHMGRIKIRLTRDELFQHSVWRERERAGAYVKLSPKRARAPRTPSRRACALGLSEMVDVLPDDHLAILERELLAAGPSVSTPRPEDGPLTETATLCPSGPLHDLPVPAELLHAQQPQLHAAPAVPAVPIDPAAQHVPNDQMAQVLSVVQALRTDVAQLRTESEKQQSEITQLREQLDAQAKRQRTSRDEDGEAVPGRGGSSPPSVMHAAERSVHAEARPPSLDKASPAYAHPLGPAGASPDRAAVKLGGAPTDAPSVSSSSRPQSPSMKALDLADAVPLVVTSLLHAAAESAPPGFPANADAKTKLKELCERPGSMLRPPVYRSQAILGPSGAVLLWRAEVGVSALDGKEMLDPAPVGEDASKQAAEMAAARSALARLGALGIPAAHASGGATADGDADDIHAIAGMLQAGLSLNAPTPSNHPAGARSNNSTSSNPKNQLQEWCMANKQLKMPQYVTQPDPQHGGYTSTVTVSDINRDQPVVPPCRGSGANKKAAEMAAAGLALQAVLAAAAQSQ